MIFYFLSCEGYRSRSTHPIPKQTDILQALSGAQYLSVFDALSSFTQMEFDEESHPITAICMHRGLHHFKCMPFRW
jgi:hypothetical protein